MELPWLSQKGAEIWDWEENLQGKGGEIWEWVLREESPSLEGSEEFLDEADSDKVGLGHWLDLDPGLNDPGILGFLV